MELQLSTRQQQKLIITQDIRQSIEILQMSSQELIDYLNERLGDNPFIDSIDAVPGTASYHNKKTMEFNDDWRLNGSTASEKSLEEALLEQLQYLGADKQTQRLCRFLIQSLNEDGYLDEAVEVLARHIGAPLPELKRALQIIQGMEPRGVGAMNLQECLLLQLDAGDPQNELVRKLITHDLIDIANRNISRLADKYAVSADAIMRAAERIGKLNPKPGLMYDHRKPEYSIPDINVQLAKNQLEVTLEDNTVPVLSWNSFYQNMYKQTSCNETRSFLRQHWTAARHLSKCIEQRRNTLLNVAAAMFGLQKDFCKHGPSYIKPMSLKEIAGMLNVHESTVSRAIRGKYALTPWGVFGLKHFYSASIRQNGKEAASALQLKELIREIISAENKADPLSDQKITGLLLEKGMMISRRTVAKYRESMNISPAAQRNKLERFK